MFNSSILPSLPTGHRGKLVDLASHEYFGEDFAKGNMSAVLLQSEKGTFTVLWGWGSSASDCCSEQGSSIRLQHTQTGRKSDYLTVVAYLNNATDLAALTSKSVAHWTLK